MTPSPHPPQADVARQLERYRGELRLYCYRMLGSSHDSDAHVRDVFARATSAPDAARLRAWLYGWATAVCFDELGRRRERRGAVTDGLDPSELTAEDLTAERERWPAPWVEPCPDSWWQQASADAPAPRYDRRQSVGLAFLGALQYLPPVQRALVILRDVAALPAEDIAAILDVADLGAALDHARATFDTRLGGQPRASAGADQVVLARYARAWHDGDIDALLGLLHDDIHTTRPPSPTPLAGREANQAFYRHLFGPDRTGPVRLRRIAANGQPAFAFYRAAAPDAPCALCAIQLVELRDGKIARIDQFMLPRVFALFGVPPEVSPDAR